MNSLSYHINKGINRSIEFRGLKAQYIYYLAIGLAALLVGFTIMYISGIPVYITLPVILLCGSVLFGSVYRLSHKYGEHGMMKALAYKQIPSTLICHTRDIFKRLINNPNPKLT